MPFSGVNSFLYLLFFCRQFLDDPGLKNDIRNKPVQLPLAHSGWLFKEEDQEEVKLLHPSPKEEEEMDVDVSSVKGRCISEGGIRPDTCGSSKLKNLAPCSS